MKNLILICVIVALLGNGCDEQPNPEHTTLIIAPQMESRIKIARVGVFDDDLAYDHKRGIYIIKDNITGKEYIGVSGIGVSELGSHTEGKYTHNDER